MGVIKPTGQDKEMEDERTSFWLKNMKVMWERMATRSLMKIYYKCILLINIGAGSDGVKTEGNKRAGLDWIGLK